MKHPGRGRPKGVKNRDKYTPVLSAHAGQYAVLYCDERAGRLYIGYVPERKDVNSYRYRYSRNGWKFLKSHRLSDAEALLMDNDPEAFKLLMQNKK